MKCSGYLTKDFIGLDISIICNLSVNIYNVLKEKKNVKNFEIEEELLNSRKMFMLNSTDVYNDNNELDTYSLVIEDITEIRKIEKQLSQNEKFLLWVNLPQVLLTK